MSSCFRTSGGEARLVNDESVLSARSLTLEASGDVLGHFLRKAGKSNNFSGEDEISELRAQIPPGLFTQIPVRPYILMFHLELHHHVWVHVGDMRPYHYQPELKKKLVPPVSAAANKTLVGKIAKALRETYPELKAGKFVYVDL